LVLVAIAVAVALDYPVVLELREHLTTDCFAKLFFPLNLSDLLNCDVILDVPM
jgi:hypothetical protein